MPKNSKGNYKEKVNAKCIYIYYYLLYNFNNILIFFFFKGYLHYTVKWKEPVNKKYCWKLSMK